MAKSETASANEMPLHSVCSVFPVTPKYDLLLLLPLVLQHAVGFGLSKNILPFQNISQIIKDSRVISVVRTQN